MDSDEKKNEIIIRLVSHEPWQIQIDGQVENLNLALAMLAEASRSMEMEWRIGAMKEAKARELESLAASGILDKMAGIDLKKLMKSKIQ